MMTEQVATVWRWWPRSTRLKHLVFQPTLGIHFLNRYVETIHWKRILLSTPACCFFQNRVNPSRLGKSHYYKDFPPNSAAIEVKNIFWIPLLKHDQYVIFLVIGSGRLCIFHVCSPVQALAIMMSQQRRGLVVPSLKL